MLHSWGLLEMVVDGAGRSEYFPQCSGVCSFGVEPIQCYVCLQSISVGLVFCCRHTEIEVMLLIILQLEVCQFM